MKISPWAEEPDLRYKFWQLLAMYSNLAVAIVGFIALIWSLNATAKSLRSNVQSTIITRVTDLDKVFVEKPYLWPYFYGDQLPDPKDGNYQEVVAVAEMFTDVMDVVASQGTRFRKEWEKPEAWDRWITDMYKHSPVLRQFLMSHRGWYSDGLFVDLERASRAPRTTL